MIKKRKIKFIHIFIIISLLSLYINYKNIKAYGFKKVLFTEFYIDSFELRKLYNKVNNEIYKNVLPSINISYKNLDGTGIAGYYQRYNNEREIVLADFLIHKDEQDRKNVIAHELIHFYIDYNQNEDGGDHGNIFQREMDRINSLGLGYQVGIYYKK